MNYTFIFWVVFIALAALIYFCDRRYFMLRDTSTAMPRPYSWSRVQLAWWTLIVFTAYITTIIRSHGILPDFNNSILYLLGISSATTTGARLIDLSDETNPSLSSLSQNDRGVSFFLDILSDKNGISINRFQTIVFNIVFGIWFIIAVLQHDGTILPFIPQNDLILMGMSSGVYAALKITENKQPAASDAQSPLTVKDEGYQQRIVSVKG